MEVGREWWQILIGDTSRRNHEKTLDETDGSGVDFTFEPLQALVLYLFMWI